MEAGFFLDLVENTRDNSCHNILPVNNYCDIPLRRNSVTLVRSVVQSHDIVTSDNPSCVELPEELSIYNTHGEDLLEPEKTETCPSPVTAPIYGNLNYQQHQTYITIADISSPGSQPRQL